MSTRSSIISDVYRRLGAITGSITSGNATTVVLDALQFGDDRAVQGALLIMPDAANTTDVTRLIAEWDDSESKASWVNDRADTTYTSETFILVPKGGFTIEEVRNAINDRLQATHRSVQTMLPTADQRTLYSLQAQDWIQSRSDVLAVFRRGAQNLLDNGQFDQWKDGPAAAPTGWVLAGANGTVARSTSFVAKGAFSCAVTEAGTDVTLTQGVGLLDEQLGGRTIIAQCVTQSDTGSSVRIGINDGATTTWSSYHTGGGNLETLSVSVALAATATLCDIIGTVVGTEQAFFSNFIAQDAGAIDATLTNTGDSAYRLQEIAHNVRDIGGSPVIDLAATVGRSNQLVVYSKQPYPTLSADSEVTDCPDSVIVPGAVFELARIRRPGVDRERMDVIETRTAREYARTASRLLQVPTPRTQQQVIVRGG